MKQFLKKTFTFLSLFIAVVITVLILTSFLVKKQFNYTLSPNVNTLILGDSHTLCSVDDHILKNSINLSESADTYFFSYIKLREINKHNPEIKNLILGFASHNLSSSQDEWLRSKSINAKKIRFYFFLFNYNDIQNYTEINPFYILSNSFNIIKTNIGHLNRIKNKTNIQGFGIGTHLKLNNTVNSENLKPNPNTKSNSENITKIDLQYLKLIKDYCKENNINLILLNTPVLPLDSKEFSEQDKKLQVFVNQKLNGTTYWDFSKNFNEAKYFADNSHMNQKGAIEFSKLLNIKMLEFTNKNYK